MKEKAIIVGAGLAGSLLAIMFAKRGFDVEIYEKRPDMRKTSISAGRSINLALSDRGLKALHAVGLDDYILREAVPMKARLIHAVDGNTKSLPYSGRESKYINSVSRGGLNMALMDKAEEYENVKIIFDAKCESIDFSNKTVTFINESSGAKITANGTFIVGADGAFSAVRHQMYMGGIRRFDYAQKYISHEYKELIIPAKADGGFEIEKNVLHIWPRTNFMMIALPNFDGSFTVTLFCPHGTDYDLKNFDSKEKIEELFNTYFPDAIHLMPTLIEDFMNNPVSSLVTLKCYPWNVAGNAVLVGDAAHAMVPFYGQGMNASFEDCIELDKLIEQYGTDWDLVFDKYTESRKLDGDAIGELAQQNYYEMSTHVANPTFVIKRDLEMKLEQAFPDFNSKYSMVTFCEDLPYSQAKSLGEAQDKILMNICKRVNSADELDINKVYKELKAKTI